MLTCLLLAAVATDASCQVQSLVAAAEDSVVMSGYEHYCSVSSGLVEGIENSSC